MTRNLSLLLILILASSSILIIDTASAQSIPKPSVPKFTLKIVSHPYDIAPTTTINPYTGKTVTTDSGYHSENKSIEVMIKNQPFNSYNDPNGNYISLMFNIRWKGHFGNEWIYFAGEKNNQEYTRDYFRPTNSEYSIWVATLSLNEWELHGENYNYLITAPEESGEIDIQVKNLMGYSTRVYVGDMIPLGAVYYYDFTGQTSNWSNIQTISIPDGKITISTSPTPNPTPTPSIPEFSWLMIIPLFIFILSIAVAVRFRKTCKITQH